MVIFICCKLVFKFLLFFVIDLVGEEVFDEFVIVYFFGGLYVFIFFFFKILVDLLCCEVDV